MLFALRTLEYCLLTVTSLLFLLGEFKQRTNFNLRLLHFAAIALLGGPVTFLSLGDHSLNFAFVCVLATVAFLILEYPLLATVPTTFAINLDLNFLVYLPVICVFSIATFIKNSPSAYLVKQVDHIVWKVIFLLLNIGLLNLAIWWPFFQQVRPVPD